MHEVARVVGYSTIALTLTSGIKGLKVTFLCSDLWGSYKCISAITIIIIIIIIIVIITSIK